MNGLTEEPLEPVMKVPAPWLEYERISDMWRCDLIVLYIVCFLITMSRICSAVDSTSFLPVGGALPLGWKSGESALS